MKITMSEGAGGNATAKLISGLFLKYFNSPYLHEMEDAALLPDLGKIAFTTDSFVVRPLIFKGGDIGRLAVSGTVNDLLTRGAEPKYLTAAFVLEEGLEIGILEKIVASLQKTAMEAGVEVVAGDTKVVEGSGGLIINTAGVGSVACGASLGARAIEAGDSIILSGRLGEHHAAIVSERMGIDSEITSDAAPLNKMVGTLLENGIPVHAMRDVTRGGLATILNEMAEVSGKEFLIEEEKLPVSEEVRSFAGILGLDPLYMGNEGKMAFFLARDRADDALELIRKSPYGEYAAAIGTVGDAATGGVILHTAIGGRRRLGPLYGEGLPRIC